MAHFHVLQAGLGVTDDLSDLGYDGGDVIVNLLGADVIKYSLAEACTAQRAQLLDQIFEIHNVLVDVLLYIYPLRRQGL